MNQDNERKVIFRRGDENRMVLEKDSFRDSLFQEQYLDAMDSFISVCRTMDVDANDVANIISFCGDRGEGKSSCMSTAREILIDSKVFKNVNRVLNEHEKQYEKYANELTQYPICALQVIDPSFFDNTHNIVDLVIGQLFQEAFREEDSQINTKTEYQNERYKLVGLFNRVKDSMSLLEQNRREILDNIEALDRLGGSMQLRDDISELFEAYLNYRNLRDGKGYKKILICIDDLDLNVTGGYPMLEQIRKYLSNPHCVILIALKIEQMIKVVQNALYQKGGLIDSILSVEECRDMAEKYITKMFPTEHRVQMPKVEDIINYKLELYYDYKSKDSQTKTPSKRWDSIKDAIVSEIFLKTRYLFYNRENELNSIIPRNLRSLRHLLAILLRMDMFVKGSQLSKENQIAFKKYFFDEWTNALSEEHKKIVHDILNYNDVSTKNLFVLTSLINASNETELYEWYSSKVKAYNVSVGDVLYAIQYLQETGHADLHDLLFFIQSYYSMCLYDYYDELIGEVPDADIRDAFYEYQKFEWDGDYIVTKENRTDRHVEIYALDERYRGISKLQQFVGGSYYTYEPGELMAMESVDIRDAYTSKILFSYMPRDYRELDARTIFNYMREHVRRNLGRGDILLNNSKLLEFQLCEFLALTTKMVQTAEEYRNGNYRYRDYPYYLSSFKFGNTILVFDVMAIFTNVINLRYAYDRFNEVIWINEDEKKSFYETALQQEGSLLNHILAFYNEKADNKHYYAEPLRSAYAMGRFASANIIRNADVHKSLISKIKASRENLTKRAKGGSDNLGRIIDFYRSIQNTVITLYGDADTKLDDLYTIKYEKLLEPILTLLDSVQKVGADAFNELFKSYEEKLHPKKVQGFTVVGAKPRETIVPAIGNAQWPTEMGGVDTSYLQPIFEEISKFDWSKPLNGKYIKEHLSERARTSLPNPLPRCITVNQEFNTADKFMKWLEELIEKHILKR